MGEVKVAPFLHGPDTTMLRMADMAIALLPVTAGAIWFFGLQAVLILGLSVGGCMAVQLLLHKLLKKPTVRPDGSALVTGLILGLLLPANCPWWAVLLGDVLAIGVAKELFGGLGKNPVNPAAAARMLLLVIPVLRPAPLATAQGSFLMGYLGGCLGEVSTLLLLAGAVYLAARGLLAWRITPFYILMVFMTAISLGGCDPLAVMAWGGTAFGAFYLAADPVTSPMGAALRMCYGAGCGVVCTVLAYQSWGIGGVCCGIVLMNVVGRATEWAVQVVSRRR